MFRVAANSAVLLKAQDLPNVMHTLTTRNWLAFSALLAGVDQISKLYVNAVLTLHQPIAVFPGFNITLAYNPGAAFSFLSDAGGWQRWFFTVLSTGVSIALVMWLHRMPRATDWPSRWLPGAIALILSGAVGNLIDRVVYGYVIDFVQVYYSADSRLIGFSGFGGRCYWPAFNIADAAISVGAVLLIIQSFAVDNHVKDNTDTNKPR